MQHSFVIVLNFFILAAKLTVERNCPPEYDKANCWDFTVAGDYHPNWCPNVSEIFNPGNACLYNIFREHLAHKMLHAELL